MTRVLVVTPFGEEGGAERTLMSLVRHLPARGFIPVVALLEPGSLERRLTEAGCEAVHCAACDPESQADWVRELGLARGAELVLSNKTEAQVIGALAADRAALPAVWWQQDTVYDRPLELQAASLPVAAIVCCSAHVIAAQRALTPDARIEKIPGGVPVAEIARRRGSGARVRALLGWVDSPIVGIVGRLQPWKGQMVFLEAARIVAERAPEVRFAVVGGALFATEASYADDLRARAEELGILDRVNFAGHQHDVYPWFDALDVAVHASRAEPFGLVVVEAMALGKPLVASVPGGPAEIVEDGVSGLLVPHGEPELMANAITSILEDPPLARALGEVAARRATLFSEERMVDGFTELFQDVLARG